ncbi:hypothetical protein DASC09_012440 [Saccharomycopsis crataegensis]|uniref:UPF3 domain-containing protein n=1 Tax=Saccharomycopsis crataegensis TaxID=43959 RepID=A0AAV5QGX2_9ASCO|nr:hypothetical protein DASC09_012440 [Saccharomycopsis crataegensis]
MQFESSTQEGKQHPLPTMDTGPYKIVVRLLPPKLDKQVFYETTAKFIDDPANNSSISHTYFVPGKYPANPYELPIFSRAYLSFNDKVSLTSFLAKISVPESEFSFSDDRQSNVVPQVQMCDYQESTWLPNAKEDDHDSIQWAKKQPLNNTLSSDPLFERFLKFYNSEDRENKKPYLDSRQLRRLDRSFASSIKPKAQNRALQKKTTKNSEAKRVNSENSEKSRRDSNLSKEVSGSSTNVKSDLIYIDTSFPESTSSRSKKSVQKKRKPKKLGEAKKSNNEQTKESKSSKNAPQADDNSKTEGKIRSEDKSKSVDTNQKPPRKARSRPKPKKPKSDEESKEKSRPSGNSKDTNENRKEKQRPSRSDISDGTASEPKLKKPAESDDTKATKKSRPKSKSRRKVATKGDDNLASSTVAQSFPSSTSESSSHSQSKSTSPPFKNSKPKILKRTPKPNDDSKHKAKVVLKQKE